MKTTIVEKLEIGNGTRKELFAVATSQRNVFSVRTSLTYEAHLTEWTSNRQLAELQSRYLAAPDDGAEQDAIMPQIRALQLATIEIYFDETGNTVIGSYTDYLPLDKAMTKKAANMVFPNGLTISGDKSEIARLADYVLTFGNCIKTLAGWKKACELAGCRFHAIEI